ncbi:MAG: hypothetical protein QME21_13095 [Anaerolineales bacterium]|nr:hypothetical protein [Anaerolineales bacterium]
MAFDNLNLDDNLPDDESPSPEESSNRTFLIIAAALGGIALLALACIAVYALVLLPRTREAQLSRRMTLEAQETEVAAIIAATSTASEMTAIAAAYTATPTETPVPPTATATSSPTPVVAAATGDAGAPTATLGPDMATATALHATLEANATLYVSTLTARPLQPTEIPKTGFADEVGLPAMLGMAVLLIVIIILARRLRTA